MKMLRYTAQWLTEIKSNADGVLHPSEQDIKSKIFTRFDKALEYANTHDLNNEGSVNEQEFKQKLYKWETIARYDCTGARIEA